ncbi:MAG TPA: LytR family transcriptional regulator [Candidatus Atribacteria bacterium]|nr:LytR family transcriptional regulator [Candidatus Atribacteria bacterium]
MYEINLEKKLKRNSRKYLRKKQNKKFILIISSVFLLAILIIFFKYLGIFPFSSDILSFNRLNILVVGCDEVENHGRADTIVFLSISPKTKDALILSIPRDTRVEIPGRGKDKINHAYAFGGIDLIIKTVKSFLDIPLHFYVVADFEGFISIIDALGGVEIDVEKEMHYVDKAGGVKIDLYPGKQILDGEKALEYIRFRQDKLGDLGRIKRQQKLAIALFNKIMKYNSVLKIPQLLEEVKDCINTNIELQDVITLANLFSGVSQEKLKFETIQGTPVYIDKISYLEPNVEEVQQRIKSLLYSQNSGVKVEVLNGNGLSGAAHRIAKELELQGFEIVNIGNADNFDYEKTKIVVYSKEINLDNEFKRLFKDIEIVKDYQTNADLDLVIILGKDITE